MRIICCGNPERGDDGAGLLLARRLHDLGIEAEVCTGEALELIEMWSGDSDVMVVDAVITGAPAGTVHLWNTLQALPYSHVLTSCHGFGIAEAIELARVIGNLPGRLRVCGIEGRQFDQGVRISPEVERAVENVAKEISAEARLSRQPYSRG